MGVDVVLHRIWKVQKGEGIFNYLLPRQDVVVSGT